MGNFFAAAWDQMTAAPGEIWGWFGTLSREEWLVTLMVATALGFMSMMGLKSRRL